MDVVVVCGLRFLKVIITILNSMQFCYCWFEYLEAFGLNLRIVLISGVALTVGLSVTKFHL